MKKTQKKKWLSFPAFQLPSFPALLRNSRGMTLLEVLMASAIFMVAMLAILGMQVTAMHGAKYGNQIVVATSLASDKVEELMNITPNDPLYGTLLSAVDEAHAHVDANNPINEEGNAGGPYTRSWWVVDTNAMTKTITTKVSWSDAWGVNRQVQMSYDYYIMPA